ncbi:hypothetical protein V6N11_023526 [Hibiscus sabdariffa]|uniref:Uncharacterized protein n=1 Tax=Hibiscus sabdariffa TaxID=183260 RepID=A0ABR2TMF6_9ROSI
MKTESKQGLKLVDGPLDELNLEELLMLHVEMIELSEKLKKHHKERLVKDDTSSSMSVGGCNEFYQVSFPYVFLQIGLKLTQMGLQEHMTMRLLGRCSILVAELWIIHDIIFHAWRLGYIHRLLSRYWETRICHVRRDANLVEDKYASLSCGALVGGLELGFFM